MAQHSFFELDNAENWILDYPFHLFLLSGEKAVADVKPSAVALGKRKAKSPPPSNDQDVMIISSDSDRNHALPKSGSRPVKIAK